MLKRTSLFIGLLASVVLTITLVTVASLTLMSSLRAYVGGESLWSKAQKEASEAVVRYAETGHEIDYQQFLANLRVPEGDSRARVEMNQPNPRRNIIVEGFTDGRLDTRDIDDMIWGYKYFRWVPEIARAIEFWESGDGYIADLHQLGERLHRNAILDQPPADRAVILAEIKRINTALRPIEEGFSSALGDASRRARDLLIIATTLIALGLLALSTVLIRLMTSRSEKLERQLRLNEERLLLGFEGSNAGLWDWNIRDKQVYYSPWFSEMLGYDATEMTNAPPAFVDLIHADDREHSLKELQRHLDTGQRYQTEFRVRRKNGTYLWCRSRGKAIRSATGQPMRMIGSLVDIADLKVAEAVAFTDKEMAEVTLDAIADAVIATDAESRITYCNKVAENLLGQSAAHIHGWPLTVACRIVDESTNTEIDDIVAPALGSGTILAADSVLVLHRMDGETIPIDHSVAPIRNASGDIVGAVLVFHDVSEGRRQAAKLIHQADHDALTGVPNRRAFERQLSNLLARTDVPRHHAMLYLDLDQFKIVNDTCGHAAGDELICQVSKLLQQRLRDGDLLARLGGDEFGILLQNCAIEDAYRIADLLRQGVADIRFAWGLQSFSIGLSAGLVSLVPGTSTLAEIMKAADAACYMAKEKGRNQIYTHLIDDQELLLKKAEMDWTTRIRRALDENRFCLFSQPIIALQPDATETSNTSSAAPSHIEILLRMIDEDGQLILPMAFIPAAERYGLSTQLDRWVIHHTFKMLADRIKARSYGNAATTDAEPHIATCAINLSGSSLRDDQFLDYLQEQQHLFQIPWQILCFEISESAAIANLSRATVLIVRLRTLGCRFSLDDFGAGVSSFSYLKHLPVDFLKIDGSFVKDVLAEDIDRTVVAAIHQIAHAMGKKTIAELVENSATCDVLRQLGIDYAQGFGVGSPQRIYPLAVTEKRPALRLA